MIYIPILIIIIILGLDLYFTYSTRFEKKSENEKFENDGEEEVQFDNPNPWNKIQYYTHVNKYYIQIKNINEYVEKIMLWKSLPIIKSDLIDIDIDNNYLILKSHSDEEALVICNLIINHINNNLTINDIVSKNLINYSINKAKKFKLIGTKLTELIKEGLLELNNDVEKVSPLEYIDTDTIKDKEMVQKQKNDFINKMKFNDEKTTENLINNNIKEIIKGPFDRITPYDGNEYASINFN
jgi:hypothetical protein